MKTYLYIFSLLLLAPCEICAAAEPQTTPLNEMPENVIATIGQFSTHDRNLVNLASTCRRMKEILQIQIDERKATSLLRYWKNPIHCIFNARYCASPSCRQPLSFSSDGKKIASGTETGFNLYDIDQHGQVSHNFTANSPYSLKLITPAPSQLHLLELSPGTFAIWDVNKKEPTKNGRIALSQIGQYRIPCMSMSAAAFSANGKLSAVGSTFSFVRVCQQDQLLREKEIDCLSRGGITALAFSPDHNQLAIGDGNGKVTLWYLDTDQTIPMPMELPFHNFLTRINSVRFSPNGKLVAVSSQQTKAGLAVWNSDKNSIDILRTGDVESATFSPDGKIIAAIGDGGVEFIDVNDGTTTNILPGKFLSAEFSPDGKSIATLSFGEEFPLQVWRAGQD